MTTQALNPSRPVALESRALVPGPAAITALLIVSGGVVPQCRDQLAPGGAVHRRRLGGRRALSRRVRLHLGVARVHCGSARRGTARANADAGDHLRGVLPAARGRHVHGPAAARIGVADRRRRRRRRVHLRSRHAAWRRLRLRHAVQRRRRQHAHADHAVLLHHRFGDRHRAHGMVDGAAGVSGHVDRDDDGAVGGAGGEPRAVRRDRVDHDGRRAQASRSAGRRDEAGDRAAMAHRTVAARRRRDRSGDRQHRDADDRRTAVGRDVGVRAVGREMVCRARHRRRVVVVLDRRPRRPPRSSRAC